MKVQDLKKYKTLDITELSGSPWNTAEKVLGLDENDKVVMAEPEEVVTPEYVDNAIDQAMETETARTESTYLKEHQSLEDYYTKEEVDQAIEDVEVDLSNYYTKAEVDEAIENVDVSDQLTNYALISSVTADINTAIANETARTENIYAKKSEIPSLNGYATEAWVEGKGYITGVTVDAEFTSGSTNAVQSKAIYDAFYGTSSSTQMEIIESATTGVYLAVWAGSYYFKETNIPGYLALNLGEYISSDSYISQIKDGSWKNIDGSPIGGSLHTSGLGVKCPISNFSGVSGLWFNAENLDGTYDYYMVYNQDDSYVAFYKTLPVITVEAPGILDDYAKTTDIPVIPTNVSAFNNDAGYLTSHQDISGKLDTSVFNTYTGNTETILDSKADVSDIPDVSDFVTSGEVATQIGTAMASETARTEDVYAKKSEIPDLDNYYTKSETDEAIEEAISGISLEGYWTSAQTKNYVDAEITGATAFETARTESTYAKKSEIPSLDGYATEQYVDNAIAAIPPVDLSDYAKTTAVTQDIQTAIAAETARTESTYLKEHQDITGKLDKTDFNTYTGATATAIAAKQDTLVSGTNIKTINNQSLLGSGNIDIQGGGGSSPIIPAITSQTDYEAISGDVKTGDLIQVQGVVLDGYDEPQYGLFEATVDEEESEGVVRKLINWARKDNSYSVLFSDEDYPWMTHNDVHPIEFYPDTFLISSDMTADAEAFNGIGFDADGKPVIIHFAPQYDDETGEVTGITRADTPIGGGGGNSNVVELTKAEYEALDPPAADTTYIITDADVVDLNDYAMASGLTELSGTVETINSNYATKQNVTARAATAFYLPGWNNQGVITGETRYYSNSLSINGSNVGNVFKNSSANIPSIYAPTTVGTAGQPLLSDGSGAPVWGTYKFAFITQTQYDALSTKDATTIYFITGD